MVKDYVSTDANELERSGNFISSLSAINGLNPTLTKFDMCGWVPFGYWNLLTL